jgi:UDP-glucose 6-dehydrogenase
MKITVIGTGYVGLVSGACFADVGNDVLCLDVDPANVLAMTFCMPVRVMVGRASRRMCRRW